MSAVINVYNGLPYLRRAIESALAQDEPAHEVIVVDDGSTDGTPELLASYGDRLRVRRIPQSGGPAKPKNVGMEMATGDWIAFLDHDDWWFRHKLRRQLDLAERYPEAGLISSDFYVRYSHHGDRIKRHFEVLADRGLINFDEPMRRDPFEALLETNFIGVPSAVMLRADVARAVGPFEASYRNSQDYDYWLRCSRRTNFLMMSEALLYKTNHPGNISANPIRQRNYRQLILRDLLARDRAYLEGKGLVPAVRRALAKGEYYLGNLHFENGDRAQAFRSYWKGLTDDPTPANALRYATAAGKKALRALTGDRLSRRRIRKAIGHGP